MEPTTDCHRCNQNNGFKNGEFDCAWKPVGGIRTTESGGCLNVEKINKTYEEAVLRDENNI